MADPPAGGDYTQIAVLINSTVIVLCTVMKIPQIATVLRNGTTKGLNVTSLFMEFWCFTQLIAYPWAKGYPLLGFVEFILLSIQDSILIFLVMRENRRLSVTTISAFVLYLAFVSGIALGYFPPAVNSTIILTVTPLSAGGKLMQLYSIISSKSAGSVSPSSWGIAAYTAGAKLLTNYLTVHDVILMVTSGQASLLNFSICMAAITYADKKDSTKKKQ